jgi:sugar-specific transcriptional regulator TrmB
MEIRDYLKLVGLSNKEADIYIASLELGQSPITPLVRKTQIPRTSLVYLLEKLQAIGLIQITLRGSRRVYIPRPPDMVLTLLSRQQKKLANQIEAYETILPQLSSQYAEQSRQIRTRFYQDKSISKLFDHIIEVQPDEMYLMGEMRNVSLVIGASYLVQWVKLRGDKRIRVRSIRTKRSETQEPIFNASQGYLWQVRLAPVDFESTNLTLIYGDNTAIITGLVPSFGIVLTSKDYAHTMKNCFQEIWKNSTDYIPHKKNRI